MIQYPHISAGANERPAIHRSNSAMLSEWSRAAPAIPAPAAPANAKKANSEANTRPRTGSGARRKEQLRGRKPTAARSRRPPEPNPTGPSRAAEGAANHQPRGPDQIAQENRPPQRAFAVSRDLPSGQRPDPGANANGGEQDSDPQTASLPHGKQLVGHGHLDCLKSGPEKSINMAFCRAIKSMSRRLRSRFKPSKVLRENGSQRSVAAAP